MQVFLSFSQFFNQVLVMGKSSVSDLSEHVFDLIQELFAIDPMLLTSVMPQLEFKLKVIPHLISHPQTMADLNLGPATMCEYDPPKSTWSCFDLGRVYKADQSEGLIINWGRRSCDSRRSSGISFPCCCQWSYFLFLFLCPPFSLFLLCTCTPEQRWRGASRSRPIAGQAVWGQRFRAGISEPAPVAVLPGPVSSACL